MTIHLLNCATMSPWFPRWHVGGLVFLVDTEQGPVLVDSGLGMHDHIHPSGTVRFFNSVFGIHHAPEETALAQIQKLGFKVEDIHHIVQTHLHFDHAGGLPDFPDAKVHLHRREHKALLHSWRWLERPAYDPLDFKHDPQWVFYEKIDSDWLGWDAIRLPFSPEMYLIPLFGHTQGHCGVAMQTTSGWLFHCADALPINADFHIAPAWLKRMVLGPHVPLLEAFSRLHPEVRIFAGHTWRNFFEDPEYTCFEN